MRLPYTKTNINYKLSKPSVAIETDNILSVITDRLLEKESSTSSGLADYFQADLVSSSDYYPFGMVMGGRSFSSNQYRYGFNGKEKDDELKGSGNSYDFGARIYDARLGRWLAVDPNFTKYADLSPYNFTVNNPIRWIDPDGKDPIDPRTGSTFKINLWRAAIYVLNFDKNKQKVVRDEELLDNIWNYWYGIRPPRSREGLSRNGWNEPIISHKHETNLEHTSDDALKVLGGVFNISHPYGSFGAPDNSAMSSAARKGTYVFLDDRYAESEWLYINTNSYNIISVEENYITQIVKLSRPNDKSKFSISSITNFSIKKGEVQTREVKTWWGGDKNRKV